MASNAIQTMALFPCIIALACMLCAAFCQWVHIYDVFIGPVYRVKMALTWVEVWYPPGQDVAKFTEIALAVVAGTEMRSAFMSEFDRVRSWRDFGDAACAPTLEGHMRYWFAGEVCTTAMWTQFLAGLTTVLLACAGFSAMVAIVQFYTGAVVRRSRSYIFPAITTFLLVMVQLSALGIGFCVFEMFQADRMFFPSWGFLLALVAMLASGVSVMLSCATIEDDLDFEEYMEDKAEEREYLMRYGQAQVAAPPPPRQPHHAAPAYPGYGGQPPYAGQPYAGQPYAGQPPAYAGQHPAYAGQPPAYAGQQPAYAGQQPAYAGQQPAYAGQQPAYAGQQPGYAGPAYAGPYAGQQPAYGGQPPPGYPGRPRYH